jgi:hypothetical protein
MTYKFSKGHAMNDQNASVAARNSKLNRISRGLLASVGLTAFVLISATAQAQVAPPLGVAQQFGALGNSGVTGSTGTGTVVGGDVGSSPTATISNFPPSSTVPPYIVHLANDAVVQQARVDAIAAFGALSQGPGTALVNDLSTVGALTPGIYSVGAADLPAGTTLTLNDPTGTGVFIFNVGSSLTANTGSSVIGTANPCNIYWQVGTSATLNGTSFRGTVIADASITVGAGSNLTGRALAGTGATGAVTMAGAGGNTIGGCSFNAPLVTGPVVPTVSKSFSPTTISAGGTSTLTITLSNTSVDTADTITSLTDNLPSGMLIAATPNASTTCGGAVTAVTGTSTVSLGAGGTIPAATLATNTAGSCTVSVDVTAASAGSLVNTVAAGGLVTDNGNNAAPASATLTVTSLVATSVPTLSEWAMIMLVALLAMTGFVAMRRQV